MLEDVIGRVRKTRLAPDDCLMPLFEALVNSFDAIAERNRLTGKAHPGRIDIWIHRDAFFTNTDPDTPRPVNGFTVRDNGVGFDAENYDSFNHGDSTYKYENGGKGIGRFLWLKAFKRVEIKSIFRKDEKCFRRALTFELTRDGVSNDSCEEGPDTKTQYTTVDLVSFKPSYKERCPLDALEIAYKIIEHCLILFLSNGPAMVVHDAGARWRLNDLYKDRIREEHQQDFQIKSKDFRLRYFRLLDSSGVTHRLHYCANDREVTSRPMKDLVPDFTRKLADENSQYYLAAYLSGEYLDNHVDDFRTGFTFRADALPDSLSEDEFWDGIATQLAGHLEPHLVPIREDKIRKIENYVRTKNPRFRYVVKHARGSLDSIPAVVVDSEAKLDQALSKLDFEANQTIRAEFQYLLDSDLHNVQDPEEYLSKLKHFIDDDDDLGKSRLADYVLQRKRILDLLKKGIDRKPDGKFPIEKYIHDLICPLGKTSDDVPIDRINLWVIDERLSYHAYLASDKSMRSIEEGNYQGQERSDLAIFDRSHSFSDSDAPYDTVVIVEFKQPGRDDYSDGPRNNPIDQTVEYVERFSSGRLETQSGGMIQKIPNRRFFCYIVADLKPSLDRLAERRHFNKTPDNQGRWTFWSVEDGAYSYYIEIIPYAKLLKDSQRRNRILFDKLNIL